MLNEKIKEVDSFSIKSLDKYYNTSIIGLKRLSVEDRVYAFIVEEALKSRNVSSTFFVSSRDEAYKIYSLAKVMKRRVVKFSPSSLVFIENDNINSFELMKEYVNYSNYIANNYIVILDVEYINDKILSKRFIASMLDIIEESMINVSKTNLNEHNIYFDDAHLYLEYIDELFYYSREYNTKLFFFIRQYIDSRHEEELSYIVNNSVSKVVLPTAYIKDKIELLNNDRFDMSEVALILDDEKVFARLDFESKDYVEDFFDIEEKKIKSIKRALDKKRVKIEASLVNIFEKNNEFNQVKLNDVADKNKKKEDKTFSMDNNVVKEKSIIEDKENDISIRRKNLLAIDDNREELDIFFDDTDEDL